MFVAIEGVRGSGRSTLVDMLRELMPGCVSVHMDGAVERAHVAQVILPALRRGETVIADGYVFSAMARMGVEELAQARALFDWAPMPDLLVHVSVLTRVAMERLVEDGDDTYREIEAIREALVAICLGYTKEHDAVLGPDPSVLTVQGAWTPRAIAKAVMARISELQSIAINRWVDKPMDVYTAQAILAKSAKLVGTKFCLRRLDAFDLVLHSYPHPRDPSDDEVFHCLRAVCASTGRELGVLPIRSNQDLVYYLTKVVANGPNVMLTTGQTWHRNWDLFNKPARGSVCIRSVHDGLVRAYAKGGSERQYLLTSFWADASLRAHGFSRETHELSFKFGGQPAKEWNLGLFES